MSIPFTDLSNCMCYDYGRNPARLSASSKSPLCRGSFWIDPKWARSKYNDNARVEKNVKNDNSRNSLKCNSVSNVINLPFRAQPYAEMYSDSSYMDIGLSDLQTFRSVESDISLRPVYARSVRSPGLIEPYVRSPETELRNRQPLVSTSQPRTPPRPKNSCYMGMSRLMDIRASKYVENDILPRPRHARSVGSSCKIGPDVNSLKHLSKPAVRNKQQVVAASQPLTPPRRQNSCYIDMSGLNGTEASQSHECDISISPRHARSVSSQGYVGSLKHLSKPPVRNKQVVAVSQPWTPPTLPNSCYMDMSGVNDTKASQSDECDISLSPRHARSVSSPGYVGSLKHLPKPAVINKQREVAASQQRALRQPTTHCHMDMSGLSGLHTSKSVESDFSSIPRYARSVSSLGMARAYVGSQTRLPRSALRNKQWLVAASQPRTPPRSLDWKSSLYQRQNRQKSQCLCDRPSVLFFSLDDIKQDDNFLTGNVENEPIYCEIDHVEPKRLNLINLEKNKKCGFFSRLMRFNCFK